MHHYWKSVSRDTLEYTLIFLSFIFFSHRVDGFFCKSADNTFLAFSVILVGNFTSSCNNSTKLPYFPMYKSNLSKS